MTYWVLMLVKTGEVAGLPMAVYTTLEECQAEIVDAERTYRPDDEMRWKCLGVIMPEETGGTSE